MSSVVQYRYGKVCSLARPVDALLGVCRDQAPCELVLEGGLEGDHAAVGADNADCYLAIVPLPASRLHFSRRVRKGPLELLEVRGCKVLELELGVLGNEIAVLRVCDGGGNWYGSVVGAVCKGRVCKRTIKDGSGV